MLLELIIDPALIKHHYGSIPETYDAPARAYERFSADYSADDYKNAFDRDFVEPVNALCNSLIDRGDIDYLNANQCKQLIPWLEERLKRRNPYLLDEFYEKLLEYSRRAVALGTGIVLDL